NDGSNNDDARMYSLHLAIEAPVATGSFASVPMSIVGGKVSMQIDMDVAFQLRIETGVGEYKDGDYPSKGGKQSGDEANCQEVFRDSGFLGLGTSNLYLVPKTYQCMTK